MGETSHPMLTLSQIRSQATFSEHQWGPQAEQPLQFLLLPQKTPWSPHDSSLLVLVPPSSLPSGQGPGWATGSSCVTMREPSFLHPCDTEWGQKDSGLAPISDLSHLDTGQSRARAGAKLPVVGTVPRTLSTQGKTQRHSGPLLGSRYLQSPGLHVAGRTTEDVPCASLSQCIDQKRE